MTDDTASNESEPPDIASSTDDYATRFHGATGQWFLEVQQSATLRMLPRRGRLEILDVGGGHGQNLACLLDAGHSVTVTGSDSSCALRLQEQLQRPGAAFVECPLTKLPFADRSFDWVISYRILPHLKDWPSLVSELCRVSRYGVIVDYPTRRSFNCLQEALFAWKKGVEKNTRTYHVFEERAVVQEYRANGFSQQRRFGQFVLPMALHRAHRNKAIAAAAEGLFRILGLSWCFGSPVIASFERHLQPSQAMVDCHVHIYPSFDLGILLDSVLENKRKKGTSHAVAVPILCLVERAGQHWFRNTCDGHTPLPHGWTLEIIEAGRSFRLNRGKEQVTFLAGRQIVTAERLEILALGADLEIMDGQQADEVVTSIEDSACIPVLAWAPGKWELARSKVVGRLLQHFGPESIAIGDTTLRPALWDGGKWMRYARREGFAVLPGSDPLPLTSEQSMAGRFTALMDLDPCAPSASLLSWFRSPVRIMTALPCQRSLFEILSRMWRHSMSKHPR